MLIDGISLFKIILIAIGSLALVAWLLLHLFWHAKPTPVESFEALTAQIGQGQPTLLYFYSNF